MDNAGCTNDLAGGFLFGDRWKVAFKKGLIPYIPAKMPFTLTSGNPLDRSKVVGIERITCNLRSTSNSESDFQVDLLATKLLVNAGRWPIRLAHVKSIGRHSQLKFAAFWEMECRLLTTLGNELSSRPC